MTSGSDPTRRNTFLHKQHRRFQNDTVGKSQHIISPVLQIRVAARVPLRSARLAVNTAVQFHDEAVLRAAKVRDVGTHRVLPTELENPSTGDSEASTTPLAQLRFGRREVRALYRSVPPRVPGSASGDRDGEHSRFYPLTRPAPAGENAGCGPPSPPRGRGLRSSSPTALG